MGRMFQALRKGKQNKTKCYIGNIGLDLCGKVMKQELCQR